MELLNAERIVEIAKLKGGAAAAVNLAISEKLHSMDDLFHVQKAVNKQITLDDVNVAKRALLDTMANRTTEIVSGNDLCEILKGYLLVNRIIYKAAYDILKKYDAFSDMLLENGYNCTLSEYQKALNICADNL